MTCISWSSFETALGYCGIAWKDGGAESAVVALQIPEASREKTIERLVRKSGATREAEPPAPIGEAIEIVQRHLSGEIQDFRVVPVDLSGEPPFAQRVYERIREIAPGETMTYGELARALGQPGAARAVGGALGRNPVGIVVPCHRVLATGAKPGGFSAHGGVTTKEKLLALEGVQGWGSGNLSLF